MNNIVEQKSNLAKLLATENVTVQHQNVQTASFNPKNKSPYITNLEENES